LLAQIYSEETGIPPGPGATTTPAP
jgi:hypothetical protein